MAFSVLLVCTGNVCRSPMAELLFRAWADPDADLVVSSSGMAALVGHGIDTSTASVLGQLGIDPTRHRARQFEPHQAVAADLVLTAEATHRDAIMAEVPSAFRRTFTMKEFARLARHATATEPATVVAELARWRGVDGPPPPEADDMPDPYRGRINQAREVAAEVTAAVRATVDALGFAPRPVIASAVRPAASVRPAAPAVRPAPRPAPSAGPARRPSPRPRPRFD